MNEQSERIDTGNGDGPQWRFLGNEGIQSAADGLAAELHLPPLLARLLLQRGYCDPEEARLFLEPRLNGLHDPFALPDVDKAVDRLIRALENKEKIFVHGDYDVDGVSSTALYIRALTALGANVEGFVPRRSSGYDLRRYGVDLAREKGANLILTSDCGSCALDAIEYARTLGLDVIVSDHHRPGPVLPPAVAIVNPYREDCTVPFRELCGAGVAFKVMEALVSRVAPHHLSAFRHQFVDLAALGTVADVTPLKGENRILVAYGLRALAEGKKAGVRELIGYAKLNGKTIDAHSISWKISPALNAAGRMADADLSYRLLMTKDPDEARRLMQEIGVLREQSREEIARITTEALEEAYSDEQASRRVLVLSRDKWGKGVIGVAANRVVDACRRPVVMLSRDPKTDMYHGSCRSYGDFNLHDALHACHDSGLLAEFGGHSQAAGVAVKGENLAAFRDRMHELAEGHITDEPPPPTLDIDAEIEDGSMLTHNLVEQLYRLGPFGKGNEEPVLVCRGALVLRSERTKDGAHCRWELRLPGAYNSMKAMWFNNGDWVDRVGMGDNVDVAFTPVFNEWNGRTTVELSVKDARLCA